MSSRITRTLTIAAIAASLAACSSVPLDQNGSGNGSDSASAGQIMDPFNPQSPLAQQRSVYFDFDSYTVPEQYRSVVEMHANRSEEHTSELQSRENLVCRLLL